MTSNAISKVSVQPEQSYAIDRFRPKDAEGVARLFRSVYGDSYPVATYVEPELLIRENADERVISSVARTTDGEIVGHNALFNSAAHPGTYESGAGVVHQAHRGGKRIFTDLVAHGLELVKTLPDVNAVFSEPACNHPFSQKMTIELGFTTRALEVDLMPAEAYYEDSSASGRVAAFLDFRTIRQKPHAIYLPHAYRQVLDFLYADLDDQRDLRLAGTTLPAQRITNLQLHVFDFASVARVVVYTTGLDFQASMTHLEAELEKKKIMVTQIFLNLAEPWVWQAVETLRHRGYFLGGVLLRWFDTDGLLMQKTRKAPEWDKICTHAKRHRQILALVHEDWQRAIRMNK